MCLFKKKVKNYDNLYNDKMEKKAKKLSKRYAPKGYKLVYVYNEDKSAISVQLVKDDYILNRGE